MSKDLMYWGNQHGHGIKIQGKLYQEILNACKITGETPEEFVQKVLDNLVGDTK